MVILRRPVIVGAFLVLLVLGCKSKQKMRQEDKAPTLQMKAKQLFQSDFKIVNNFSETYALVLKEIKTRPNQIFPTLSFFVYEYNSKDVIYEQSLSQGNVIWMSNHELLCESVAGRVNDQEKTKKYVYDVRTKLTKPFEKK